jgi:hypothetical protein
MKGFFVNGSDGILCAIASADAPANSAKKAPAQSNRKSSFPPQSQSAFRSAL